MLTDGKSVDSTTHCSLSSPSGKRGRLSDGQWVALVERLLELAHEDFECAVLAVRLQRRFEEVNP